VGLTALALLAFIRGGHGTSSPYSFEHPLEKGRTISFSDTVRKGLRWLDENQDGEGCFGKQKGEFLYDHAIATLALAEAVRTCGQTYRKPAQRGIQFLLKAQNPGYAWRYSVRPGDNDTSVTGWCVQAIVAAERAGLQLDRAESSRGVLKWLERATNSRGLVGYESPGDAGAIIVGVNDRWRSHPTMTAVGLWIKLSLVENRDAWMKVAANTIMKDLPLWDEKNRSIDYYYWHYGALALSGYDAPAGSAWNGMSKNLKAALLPHQNLSIPSGKDGKPACTDGSWEAGVDKWAPVGGRVYATAINTLTLEVLLASKTKKSL